jgi:uncharacterized repeat protein (TIGR03803 family)
MKKVLFSVLLVFAVTSCAHGAGSVENGLPSSPAARRDARTGGNTSGVFRVLHSFKGGNDAAGPSGPLVFFDDRLWGTTFLGGSGNGTIFSYDLKTGRERVAYSFQGGADGSTPAGGLILLNGLLYGTTGSLTTGTIFSFDPANDRERVLHVFSSKDGTNPSGGLTAVNGILYGTASAGGIITPTNPGQPNPNYGCNDGCGTFFSLDPASGNFQVIHSFTGSPDGSNPQAAPVAVNGTLYGTTMQGGDPSICAICGTVYAIGIASGQERVVYSFEGAIDGQNPAGLMFARGRLYGTTSQGGNGSSNCDYGSPCGTVFSIIPSSGLERVVYRFGSSPDGSQPGSALTARGGKLYGTAQIGGTGGGGTIFSIDMTTRSESTLFSFPRSSSQTIRFPLGCDPSSPLLFVHGIYYGTTMACGPFDVDNDGSGTLFAFKPK